MKWTMEALFNILDNAVKYTPKGGSVTIGVLVYSMFVRIDVADTGVGIAEEEHGQIFSRFYRSQAVHDQTDLRTGERVVLFSISSQTRECFRTVTFERQPGNNHVIKSVL